MRWRRRRAQRNDKLRRLATRGFLGPLLSRGGGSGSLQTLLGGGGGLLSLRLSPTSGLVFVALLLRILLRRLPEVGGWVDAPSHDGRLHRPPDRGGGDLP